MPSVSLRYRIASGGHAAKVKPDHRESDLSTGAGFQGRCFQAALREHDGYSDLSVGVPSYSMQ